MNEPPNKPDILIVDDEAQMRSVLRGILEEAGYGVRDADSGRSAIGEVVIRQPDVMVLDLGLPDLEGRDVLKAIRVFSACPTMILSVTGREDAKIAALDAGADDYLTKPFGAGELLARIRALQRRIGTALPLNRFAFGPIEIDFGHRRVTKNGKLLNLTATEFSLLRLLIVHRDQVLTHRYILKEVWGPNSEEHTHYLRTYMTRIRQKLGSDVSSGGYFQTESRVGYRFVTEP